MVVVVKRGLIDGKRGKSKVKSWLKWGKSGLRLAK